MVMVCQKITCGIHGISFLVMSSEYSPIEVETKIFEFIENFYNNLFDKKTFESYKNGTINRKRAGYKSINDEADDLIDSL